MAKFKPYKLLESQLDSLPIQEGQFILTTDTNKLYSDTAADTRILISPDAITDLSVNGTTITYTRLDGTTGTITTKDTTYSVASITKNGLMSASDKEKLDTIEKGAQANTITGVKGDSESLYRTGNVNITKTNIGLNNVENKSSATIRGELTNSNVTTALGYTPLNSSLKGANNGLAELDASGKVPASQLPSYVDDVLEYSAKANFPTTGETGKIYVDTSTNKTYRWGGSAYAEISPSIVLGTTSSTAFRGDYGQIAYTHAVTNKGSKFDSGLYKITTNAEGHVTDATEVAKSDITALGIPAQDTTYNAATTSAAGLMSPADKTKLNSIAAGAQKNTITGVKGSAETSYRTGNVNITAANIGLGNVENKSSEAIREELTKANVTTALGYTPPTIDTDTTYTFATGDSNGTIKVTPSSGSAQNVSVRGLGSLAYKSSLTAGEVGAIASSLKGAANGVAELDSNGKVPSAQLPSYVDDVVEYNSLNAFPSTGESGKIYLDISTNLTYRWSGSGYVIISSSLALGETNSTAYRGDRGKIAYDHSQKTSGNPHKVTKSDIGLGNVDNTADANKTVKEAKKTTGTLTIQKNGTNVQTFNGSSNITANIAVPTKVSELSNDSGYLTTHQDITGKTNTSVLPNDNGEIKTKFRISNKGYTGSGSTVWYYPLCKFPSDNTGNYASAIISGRIGGWVNSNMSSINALCWNRDSTGIALLDIAGGASSMSNIWNICDIVIYTDANATTDTVYLKCTSYFTFDLDLELFQSSTTILYNGSYLTTEPTGTLNAKASTTTKRVEIINGEMYVAGHKALTANNYTNYTTSKADTIKSLSISGKTLTYTKGDDTTGSLTTQDTTYSDATQTVHGLMSTTDKKKLDGIATGATANSASSTTPKVAGTAAVGSETSFARGDHVHPAQTTVSGNAGTATKLATARTINGVSFDGSANITITANPTTTTLTSEDLDDIKTPGLYNANGGNTTINKPSGIDAYGLFVYKTAGGYTTQELTSGNINSLKKYIRQYTDSWSDWKNIVEDNGVISSNDTIKNIVTLTKSEYDALIIKERNTLYNITDDISEEENPDSDSSISITKIIDIIYPVGSIYISANTVNPSTFLGGNWKRIKDTFLWAAGDNDVVGKTGGEKTHTLTIDEIPSHTHIQNAHSHEILSGYGEGSPGTDTYRYQYWAKDGRSWKSGNLGTSSKTATNQNTGGGQAHNNMPPYLVVYMWKRLS